MHSLAHRRDRLSRVLRRRPLRRPGRSRCRPLRAARARLRAQGVSEQDRAFHDQRCRSQAAAATDAGVLRLLRLAFDGARSLAARSRHQAVSEVGSRAESTRGTRARPDAAEHRCRGHVPDGAWTGIVRASVRPRVGAARRRAAQLDDRQFREWSAAGAAGNGGGQEAHDVAAEARLSDPHRRARPDGVRVRPRLGLGQTTKDQAMEALLREKAKQFYLGDKACPPAYEPSGQDFLSPCLAEADFVRRVLGPQEFARGSRPSCRRPRTMARRRGCRSRASRIAATRSSPTSTA